MSTEFDDGGERDEFGLEDHELVAPPGSTPVQAGAATEARREAHIEAGECRGGESLPGHNTRCNRGMEARLRFYARARAEAFAEAAAAVTAEREPESDDYDRGYNGGIEDCKRAIQRLAAVPSVTVVGPGKETP